MIHAFDGHTPVIHPEAFVHPDGTVIGRVTIGARASVWPGTVLRGDMGAIVIGEETSVQDGAIVHMTLGYSETIVGARVTIGHRAVLHGCVVEDECLIGMGAIVLDRARIGCGSLVAAGAVVLPGAEIPPGSLVLGSPATAARSVRQKDREMIDSAWRTYVEYSARYKQQLAR